MGGRGVIPHRWMDAAFASESGESDVPFDLRRTCSRVRCSLCCQNCVGRLPLHISFPSLSCLLTEERMQTKTCRFILNTFVDGVSVCSPLSSLATAMSCFLKAFHGNSSISGTTSLRDFCLSVFRSAYVYFSFSPFLPCLFLPLCLCMFLSLCCDFPHQPLSISLIPSWQQELHTAPLCRKSPASLLP